jgi:uncharacterized protein with ParB-like and HNH nuclease domain/predicted transport protein
MKANEAQLLKFLKKVEQLQIPIYQRMYSWTERECQQLWDDIVRSGANDDISAHFVGSIVYIEGDLHQVANFSPVLVIDGQQRLTTVTLLVAALVKALQKAEVREYEPVDDFTPNKLRNYYLVNPEESGERRYKLLLSRTDKDSLIAVVEGTEPPKEPSLRVMKNFAFFEAKLAEHKSNLAALFKGISKLMVVDLALNRGQDNPQLIFESMNSTGRELSQADLIRNFLLMGVEPHLQTKLYDRYWHPIEVDFGQEAYDTHFDGFMRHYLTVKTGIIPKQDEVYEAFKSYARSPQVAELGIEALVSDIREFAQYFCAMALGTEIDTDLKRSFRDLRELKVDVAYPFLLELYKDYRADILSKDDLVEVVRLVEAYVFRRAICAIPTNSLNKTFATFTKALKKDRYLEGIKAHFLGLPSYRRFPSDEEFHRDLQTRDLYNFRSRSYWLRRLENYGHKEWVQVDEYTIEHIMPQNENLSSAWKEALGPNWKAIHQKWLHTLGNLTLTGYNSEYGDRAFVEKRDMKGGFAESPIRLNTGLGKLEQWNEDTIKERASTLADLAVDVWKSPTLPASILQTYREHPHISGYSLSDHPYLLSSPTRELFEALRREVLALDPCVTEEYLKVYVAYKAETNFVDVVPQSKRLRLSLNIGYVEIDDPRGMCKDVTLLGRWSNGDVEVGFASLDELPYVMGLVRQALEKQLGNGGDQ